MVVIAGKGLRYQHYLNLVNEYLYSVTSLTLQIKDTIEKTSIMRTEILVPTSVTNAFLISKRGKLLYHIKNG